MYWFHAPIKQTATRHKERKWKIETKKVRHACMTDNIVNLTFTNTQAHTHTHTLLLLCLRQKVMQAMDTIYLLLHASAWVCLTGRHRGREGGRDRWKDRGREMEWEKDKERKREKWKMNAFAQAKNGGEVSGHPGRCRRELETGRLRSSIRRFNGMEIARPQWPRSSLRCF